MIKNRTWYKIHKWFAVSVGIFILTWTGTGVLMTLPGRWFYPPIPQSPNKIDFKDISLSPAEAIGLLLENTTNQASVQDVYLKKIHGEVLYEIILTDGRYQQINARTAEVFRVTPEFAKQILQDNLQLPIDQLQVERLTQHEFLYPAGPLPTYRLIADNQPSKFYYVSERDGSLSMSNNLTRIHAAITSLHTFEPVRLVTEVNAVRKGLLVLFASVGVLTALTGYFLFLLPFFRRKTRGASENQQTRDNR